MADNVALFEADDSDALDRFEELGGTQETRLLVAGKVDLSEVASDDKLGVATHTGKEHLELSGGCVLSLVEDDKGVVESASAHKGKRSDFDGAVVPVRQKFLLRYHIAERVVERLEVGVEFLAHIARKESEVFARLDSRASEDNATHLAVLESTDGESDGSIGLTRARRTDGKDHIVVSDSVHKAALVGSLSTDEDAVAAVDEDLVVGLDVRGGRVSFENLHNVVLVEMAQTLEVELHGVEFFLKDSDVVVAADDFEHLAAYDEFEFRKEETCEIESTLVGSPEAGVVDIFERIEFFHRREVLEEKDSVRHRAFAFEIEAAVVGGVVDDAEVGTAADKHSGRAAAVEVDGVIAAQPLEDEGEFVERETRGIVFETAVGCEDYERAVAADTDSGAVMTIGDEGAVLALRNQLAAPDEHRAGSHNVAVGARALGEAVAVGDKEARLAVMEAERSILVVFAVDGVGLARCVDADFTAVDAEVADGVEERHVEERAVDSRHGVGAQSQLGSRKESVGSEGESETPGRARRYLDESKILVRVEESVVGDGERLERKSAVFGGFPLSRGEERRISRISILLRRESLTGRTTRDEEGSSSHAATDQANEESQKTNERAIVIFHRMRFYSMM